MQIRNALPPWEFLLSASRNSLQSYELSRLGHAANLRKEVAPMLDQWVEEIAAASDRDHASQSEERGTASDNFFPNSAPSNHTSRTAT